MNKGTTCQQINRILIAIIKQGTNEAIYKGPTHRYPRDDA